MKILQIGAGNFGRKHLRVWQGLRQDVYVADKEAGCRAWCLRNGFAADRITAEFEQFLPFVQAVDIVTPADTHGVIGRRCLAAGKHAFIEKPLAAALKEGKALVQLAGAKRLVLQVGHIFRYHPCTTFLKRALSRRSLGDVRYIFGHFMGFKRMRSDVGVTHTDSIHYIDAINYLLGESPQRVLSVQRDCIDRGMEDLSVTFLFYRTTLAQIESGYHAPDQWRDLTVVGSRRTVAVNFAQNEVRVFHNRFVKKNGKVLALHNGIERPAIPSGEPLRLELEAFLQAIQGRHRPIADGAAGVEALRVVEAAKRSAQLMRVVPLRLGARLKKPGHLIL
ncbi:MAG: Gfo/Idh/MocA family oxidoreductase [Elusimicrobia bacterium]|nr:Gfo/Idh/MocA family oxidoreductase [Elusimicrobiota bacterium]